MKSCNIYHHMYKVGCAIYIDKPFKTLCEKLQICFFQWILIPLCVLLKAGYLLFYQGEGPYPVIQNSALKKISSLECIFLVYYALTATFLFFFFFRRLSPCDGSSWEIWFVQCWWFYASSLVSPFTAKSSLILSLHLRSVALDFSILGSLFSCTFCCLFWLHPLPIAAFTFSATSKCIPWNFGEAPPPLRTKLLIEPGPCTPWPSAWLVHACYIEHQSLFSTCFNLLGFTSLLPFHYHPSLWIVEAKVLELIDFWHILTSDLDWW